MSVGLTLQQLFDANPDAIRANAHAWLAMADSLDDACEDLIKGSRDLPGVWRDGAAADAAWQRTLDTRNEASNAVPRCQAVGRALREFADTVSSLQHLLQNITAEAVGAGFQVDIGAGTVAVPQHMYQHSTAPHVLAQTASGYMHQLQGLLDRAAEIDAVTTGILNQNLPDTQDGFGSGGSPSLTAAEVAAQQGRSPAQVNAWWHGLTAEQQEQVLRDFPQLVGGYDGIPAEDRDTANRNQVANRRSALQAEEDGLLAQLRGEAPPAGMPVQEVLLRLEKIGGEQAKIGEVAKALDKLGERGYLLGFDPAGDGKVVVAVGNPDTAAHTGVWVPGLGTTMEGKGMSSGTVDNIDRMVSLNNAAQNVSNGATVSTVYWLGYDAPDLTNTSVVGEDRSKAGADPYVSFMQGMRASHDGDPGHLVAMGHSYGTTVLGEAALTGRLPVDDIITQGSPGMHTDDARNLNIDPKHVWAGSAASDPVSQTSDVSNWTVTGGAVLGGPIGAGLGWAAGEFYEDGHNISPHDKEFGANSYRVDTSGHSGYWDGNTESLRNQARILVGKYDRVGLNHGAPPEIP